MFIAVQLFQTTLTALLTNTSTSMKLPTAAATALGAALGSGNYTTMTLSNGVVSEIVYPTAVSGNTVTISRAEEGSTAQTFSAGTSVRFVWTEVSIQAVASGGSSGITITGSGIVTITGGPFAFNVDAPATALAAGTGIAVTGSFPNFTITNTAPGGGGGSTVVTGSGQAAVTAITGGYNVDVPTPTLSAGTGISVTGTWPAVTITNTAPASGGSGTVTSVTAGSGIAVTGSPTVNPTVSLTNSGVTPGSYGGITVDTFGRITAITGSLITSITSTTPALVVIGPSLGTRQLSIATATTSQAGLVQLAVNTSSASSNPADTTSAVTPSGVSAVIANLPGSTVGTDVVNSPLSSASYTTAAITSTTPLALLAGQAAVVTVVVDVLDTVTPTNIPQFALGLFNGGTFIDGNNIVPSATRTLVAKINGPFTGVVSAYTTAITSPQVVQNKSITVIAK